MKNRILRPILFQHINGKPFERMRNVECLMVGKPMKNE